MSSATVSARVGLAGNPSDGYGGATLAVPLPSLTATVTLEPAAAVTVGRRRWPSAGALARDGSRYDSDSGDRLLIAAIAAVVDARADSPPGGFALRWSTTIPRSVGLAGSSAIVVGSIEVLAAHWSLDLTPGDVASLALTAERDELGIAAGWQDRMVQAHGAPVLVDAGADPPTARRLHPGAELTLFAAWDERAAEPSGEIHAILRARYDSGDGGVVASMSELTEVAGRAAIAFEAGDIDALVSAIGTTCAIRARIGALSEPTRRLVEAAGSAGVVATSAGSGGSIAGVVTAGTEPALRDELTACGATVVTFDLGPDRDDAASPIMRPGA